jgi:UDP-N-acetylglucosamine--N-acetylmuramyl-(pentapeptide) pyrophosphoryl-undecaprenol N-acetylglucosamine transferase
MRVMVTGGGTGGHVAPAMAVIAELQRRHGSSLTLAYAGSAAGLEARLAGEAGIEFIAIASGKLRRSSRGVRGLLTVANVRDVFRVPIGVLQALRTVRRFRPDVVLSTGGYVAVPIAVAAGLLRRPVIVHEQTVTFGLANRLSARFARVIALSFDGSADMVPSAMRSKVVVTGNPVRSEILSGDRERGVAGFAIDPADGDLPVLFVTGGAQGSRMVNTAVRDALDALTDECVIIHQCGGNDAEALASHHASLPPVAQRRWVLRPFLTASEMGDAYALADVVVARAGAGTVTEVCVLGKATVFVPLVPTSHDEQTRNAQRVVDAGGALIVRQADCRADTLLATVEPLLRDRERRVEMSHAARSLAKPDATAALADLVDRLGAR